jgi:hypothetical protein
VSTDDSGDCELLLEPNAHEMAKAYQKAIFNDGISVTVSFVDDIDSQFERLKNWASHLIPIQRTLVQ